MIPVLCAWCGVTFQKRVGCHNRSVKRGMPEHCGMECSGLGRRTPAHLRLTPEEAKAAKAEYDRERRQGAARAQILAQKRAHHHANKERINRRVREKRASDPDLRDRHRKCQMRTTETRRWKVHKKAYDRVWRAKRDCGDFWEAQVALLEIDEAVAEVATKHELSVMRDNYNLKQERRREWERNKPEKD